MTETFSLVAPLPSATFGGRVTSHGMGAEALVRAAELQSDRLQRALGESHGLLLFPGMDELIRKPVLLLRMSRVFGPHVENYRGTGMTPQMVHAEVPEILLVSNDPKVSRAPPARPEPPLTAEGALPTRYPHRRGWHTDQSYRRPPPDVSLFLAVTPVPQGQGQTLFADATAAYEALPDALKKRIDGLEGLHAAPGTGRRRDAVLAGAVPRALAEHEQSQRQPVVRIHPLTGQRSIYLCEYGQMDWLDGPFIGMEKGPSGAGAALLDTLMTHVTQPQFVYVHEWTAGDLLVWDNRSLLHAATWFDAGRYTRMMWRTTVQGNPGSAYAADNGREYQQPNSQSGF